MNILYEDNDILAVHKPAGLATQTSRLGEKDLFSEAKNYVGGKYIGIINRLDQPVEGIVLMAKSSSVAAKLEAQIQNHSMEKYYRAHVYLDEKKKAELVNITDRSSSFSHKIECFLCRDKNNTSRICSPDEPDAKEARLEYSIREITEHEALLDIHLLTGRHHQIRVQLAGEGLPLLGDRKYGSQESITYSTNANVRFVALCAYRLVFVHPTTKKKLDIVFH